MSLKAEYALVTGGSRGIGLMIASVGMVALEAGLGIARQRLLRKMLQIVPVYAELLNRYLDNEVVYSGLFGDETLPVSLALPRRH